MSNSNKDDSQEMLLTRVQENWEKIKGLVSKIENPEVKKGCNELLDHLYDRFAVAPASTNIDFIGCFVGGLAWHSLNVVRIMKSLHTSLDLNGTVSADSMILLGLFHDIGKLGNEKHDYYVPQKSEWHREKLGKHYEVNDGMGNMPTSIRTLWWLNHFKIPLTENELHAIQSMTGKNDEISFTPSFHDTWETYLLQSAVRGALIKYQGIKKLP